MKLQVKHSIRYLRWKFLINLLTYIFLLKMNFNLATSDFHLEINECLTDVVHLPVELNSTLECSVSLETTRLIWEVNRRRFNDDIERELLSDTGFYVPSEPTTTSGRTSTTMAVYGSPSVNSSQVCCLLLERNLVECCTTTILYGLPLTPIIKDPTAIFVGAVNISWSASGIEGVNQSFVVAINSSSNAEAVTTETLFQHYIFNATDSKSLCDTFIVTVKAVNGAGESSLSNEVTFVVPSLPDIVPLSMSLRHEVWKADGVIVMRLTFELASSCIAYPTTKYLIELKSTILSMRTILISLNASNDTLTDYLTVYLGPDELEENHQYIYTVTAVNNIGKSTSEEKQLMTSDIELISARLVGRNTLIIKCYLINGSDAQGCRVMLVSHLPDVENITKEFYSSRSEQAIQGFLNISFDQVSCYHQIFAYDIENDYAVSNLAIEGNLTLATDDGSGVCTGSTHNLSPFSVTLGIVLTFTLLAVIITSSVVLIVLLLRSKNCKYLSTTRSIELHNSPSHSQSTSSGLPVESKDNHMNNILVLEAGPESDSFLSQTSVTPLYAVPNKLKATSNTSSSQQIKYNTANEVEHVYHVLENSRTKDGDNACGDIILPDFDAPELPPPLKQSSPPRPPVSQEIDEMSIKGADNMDIL